MSGWVLATEESGFSRHFDASALPVSLGADSSDDLVLAKVRGSIQFGLLDGIFFVQPLRGADNVRVEGEPLRGTRRLEDGQVIAFDTARLTCRIADGRLTLAIEAQVTAGDTAPPDFDALTKTKASELTVSPIAFKPDAAAGAESRRTRLKKSTIAVYSAFAVLGALAWFAFTAKSVSFEMTPLADSFELPDTLLKFRLGDRYMLRRGSHRIVAEREGYYPLDETVDVGILADQTFEFEFVRLPGLISFRAEPEVAAEVTIDGEVVGTTPLIDFEVRPGTRQVQFVAERYLTEVTSVDVEGGHVRDEVTLAMTPSWAPVSLTTVPAGAEVLVDGRPLDVTPATLELTAGEREIEVRLAGYNSVSREIRVFADEPQTLDPIRLSLADGRVSLESTPADATISVNGEFRGRTPTDLRLPPNVAHEIRVVKLGYEPFVEQLTLPPDGRRRIDVELEPQLGVVEITSSPPAARVLVGGEPVGETPLRLDLMTVPQDIAVELAGYAGVGETITPRQDYPQRLAYNLQLLDAVTGDGYPRIVTTAWDQRLTLIPAGQFQMGSSRSDPDRRMAEVLRNVEISKAFYLAEKEMTNAEFRRCDPEHDSGQLRGHSLNDDDQPVVDVTIQEVFACLNQLSAADGLNPVYTEENGLLVPVRPLRNGYRLPTEAEFAYALRVVGRGGDNGSRFSWGEELPAPDRTANLADQSAEDILPNVMVTYVDDFPVSAPVGSFAADAAGLFDMDGNVAEWVQDFYDPTPEGGAPVLVDPLGPVAGRSHIVRGPSWRSATVRELRLSYRDYEDEARMDLGFRIARNLE